MASCSTNFISYSLLVSGKNIKSPSNGRVDVMEYPFAVPDSNRKESVFKYAPVLAVST